MSPRLLAVAAVPVLAAGCGSTNGSPQVASLTTTSTTTSSSTTPIVPRGGSFAKFVTCMQQHGVKAQLGTQGRGVSITGTPGKNFVGKAQIACQKFLPGGGPPALTPAQQAERVKQLTKAAKCMRKNGVPNFPDPTAQGQLDLGNLRIDKSSPTVRAALQKCLSIIRKGRGPNVGIRVAS